MKIKTITTFNVYNYGASLQAFALMTYLESLGNDVQIINYQPDYLTRKYNYNWVNPESTLSRYKFTRLIYRILKYLQRLSTIQRKKAFDKFTKEYLHTTQTLYTTFNSLAINPPDADLYIAGSDQIWNVFYESGRDPAFYLEFVKHGKRASYAASFSYLDIDEENMHRISHSLHKFTAVSVRERQGLSILSKMGISGTWVLDPVFLLARCTWENLAHEPNIEDRYLLVYDFEHNRMLRDFACKYAKRNNLKIYSINDTYPLLYANRNYNNAGPSEFIGLIKNCSAFVSNSFHGTAFSIIFHKPVFVFNRSRHKVNSRMQSLLELFKLESSLITNSEDATKALDLHFDYNVIDKIMMHEIERSKSFLKNLLS